MALRAYQTEAIEQIRDHFMAGKKRVLLHLATGAGKTVIFCEMAKAAVAKGKRVGVVVRRRLLVENASQRLFRENVHHGVMMAKHWNNRPAAQVQVASIDTLIARKMKPEFDLIIIDECHDAISEGYINWLAQYGCHIVAVTATPYVGVSIRHLAQEIVHPVTMQELIDLGHLVPFRYFAPTAPDLVGVKIDSKSGDYKNDELEKRMVAGHLVGDTVEHWKALGEDGATLGFAVNIHHSRTLTDIFNAAGIKAEHCDADTPDSERAAILKRHERGETKIIWNVGIFCVGVDLPWLRVISMCRPTKSLNLFTQQAGRLTRPFPGKEYGILLDHAGNLIEHGFPTLEPEVDLDGEPKAERGATKTKICKVCFRAFRGDQCPGCGKVEAPPVVIETSEGQLEEMVASKNPVEQYLQILEAQRKKFGRKPGWVYHKLIDRFGIEAVKDLLPPWFLKFNSQYTSDPFAGSPFQAISGGKL